MNPLDVILAPLAEICEWLLLGARPGNWQLAAVVAALRRKDIRDELGTQKPWLFYSGDAEVLMKALRKLRIPFKESTSHENDVVRIQLLREDI